MRAKRLIIVGASGVIGRATMQAAAAAGLQATGTALQNITPGLISYDMSSMPLSTVCPDIGCEDIVILLAGYTSPAWIFENQKMATELNLDSSKRLVDEAVKAGARVIFVSTDLVFDGEIGGYVETAIPNPLNLYGRLKVAMEKHVSAAPSNIVVRTGWNVGWDQESHCAVSQCYENLLRPNARMATDNVINITDVDDTAKGLVEICCAVTPFPLYHLVSSQGISRAELASTIQKQSIFGANMSYTKVSFTSLPYTEPRPLRAFLRSERLASLGLTFAQPLDVITRKVQLLDRWHSAAKQA